jgi:hypothetical protein
MDLNPQTDGDNIIVRLPKCVFPFRPANHSCAGVAVPRSHGCHSNHWSAGRRTSTGSRCSSRPRR